MNAPKNEIIKDQTNSGNNQKWENRDNAVRKNDDRSSEESKEEPTPIETPATPDMPVPPSPTVDPHREYDDTDHDHVHHPPKADSTTPGSVGEFVGE